MAKNNKNQNENGYAIICLWCKENKTMDDTSNTCEPCLNERMNPKERPKGASLIIYDTI